MPPEPPIRFRLDGRDIVFDGPAATPMIELLRGPCDKTGVKLACSRAVCGSCTVLVDGVPGASCALFAWQVDGADVLTAAGLTPEGGAPHPIAAAFADHAAFQCGYCTGGMLMLANALLDRDSDPSRETVVEWVSSSVCRCTGYAMIIEAILDAARRLRNPIDA